MLNPLTAVISEALQCSPTELSDWPLIVAIFCPAGFAGTVIASSVNDVLGRSGTITSTAVMCVICGLLSGASAALSSSSPTVAFWLLFMSRCAVGLASGIGSVVVPSYLGEIAPAALKGVFGGFFQLSVVRTANVKEAKSHIFSSFLFYKKKCALLPLCKQRLSR